MSTNTTSASESLQGATLAQFFTTLTTSAIIAAVEILVFIVIRTKFKRIYEPKTYIGDEDKRVEPLPRGYLGWLPALLKMPQEDLIRTSGLDAYFFARYLYIHAFFFLSSFILIGIILIPIYVVDGKGEDLNIQGLDLLTFGNISPRQSSRYIAPLILAYVFIGAYLYLLYLEMKIFVTKRQAYLQNPAYQSHPSATTILITEIPEAYLSRDVLFRIFNQLPGGVKQIWLNRNFRELHDKVDERRKLVETFETALNKQIKNDLKAAAKRRKQGNNESSHLTNNEERSTSTTTIAIDSVGPKNRPTIKIGSIPVLSSLCLGKKVDAIDYCTEHISQLNTEIEQAKANLDQYQFMNSAFIQFNKQIAAHIAVQSVSGLVPLTMTPRYIDIKPSNIIWSNLNLKYFEIKVRQLIALAAIVALIVFWAIPVSFVGALSNINSLKQQIPFLEKIFGFSSLIDGLLTGLLPTVFLAVLMALLPFVLRLLAEKSGVPTTDLVDRYVQTSYFVFQVIHVFLFVTISSSVPTIIQNIVDNPTSIADILARSIPKASNFFLSYLALQGLSAAAGVLIQISTFIVFYLLRTILDNTPRKKWQRRSALTILSWGVIFPLFTNFIVISLVYSIIAPLILLISGLAFGVYYIVYTYSLFYVTVPSSNIGLTFPTAVYHSFTGVYLMEIMLAGLFFLAQNEQKQQISPVEGAFMCVLIGITVAVHYMMRSSFDSLTNYLSIDAEEYANMGKPKSKVLPGEKFVTKILNSAVRTYDASQPAATTVEIDEDLMENAYMHPIIRCPKPIVWLALDNLGIATTFIQQVEASEMNIQMSTDGARFDEKINIKVNRAPPDHVNMIE